MKEAFRAGFWLRVAVSAILLALVVLYAGLGRIADEVAHGDWVAFTAAAGVMAVAVILGGLRWRMLLHAVEIDLAPLSAIRRFAAGLFLNNLLPTSVGGDAVRTWVVGRESGRMMRATTVTVLDKAIATACLFAVAWLAVAVQSDRIPASLIRVFVWLTLVLVVATVVAALVALGFRPVVRRFPARVQGPIREAWIVFLTWLRSPGLIARLILLGLAYQALATLALVLVGRTVGVELSFALAAVAAAVVIVAMLIPISVGGLGIREGGFVLLLREAGVDAANATLVSLLGVAVIFVACGGIVCLVHARELFMRGLRRWAPGHL